MTGQKRKTIAVVGGGASGVLTAYHLVRQRVDARVVVIEPRAELGLGLAYGTPSMQHLLNVPAGKISALPDEPGHFLDWLRAEYDLGASESSFAPRAVFGRYLQSLLADVGPCIEQVRARVIGYRSANPGAVLELDRGGELGADRVVLALGNFAPAPLCGISEEAVRRGLYAHDAWSPASYSNLEADTPVALIGSGLTAVDVLLRLREAGHRGVITAVSRHGVLPRRHAPYAFLGEAAIPAGTAPTCVNYLRALRRALRGGTDWRAAVDSLRARTNNLWLALPLVEQRRFRRHLQRRWDVVRHRMAPVIADRVEVELAAKTLVLRRGNVLAVEVAARGAAVTISHGGAADRVSAGRVINCTGPSMRYRQVDSALMRALFAEELIMPGPLGSGLNTDREGALIGANGAVSETLFTLGPARLGTLLESIAMPEIRTQAAELAGMLAASLTFSHEEVEHEEPAMA